MTGIIGQFLDMPHSEQVWLGICAVVVFLLLPFVFSGRCEQSEEML